ncbi:hypothetical protein HHK36_032897 [Tetracentron sinense]|uniref:C3H1-type domain-containing protein n=1 Tax=Tetracentron sinense TaxID=13715 RepID=A0A834YA78_TETSI|nr:hypothetical protein HHK36_032897 [Tetracentron sinense]
MDGQFQKQKENSLNLLELSASDDLIGLRRAVEEESFDVDEASFWYGRGIWLKKMGFEERTPLMIAAMFGSVEVLKYILKTGRVDVNRACGSDRATALHCAAAGGSASSPEIVKLLLDASANANSVDALGNRPGELITLVLNSPCISRIKALEIMLKGSSNTGEGCFSSDQAVDQMEEQLQQICMPQVSKDGTEKKEYPIDPTLPDIKNGIYGTDEFRMYTFKVKPCSRAYTHDWTECPFVHPGENARRRDHGSTNYSCVPCLEFRRGTCWQGDSCEYAHGVFECWLHPAQYRTRLCKDETGCTRRVCFFAHKPEELRPLYSSTGSAVLTPRSFSTSTSSLDMAAMSPLALGSSSVSTPPMSPSAASSSLMGGALWQNQPSLIPPTLQLPENHHSHQQQQQLMDEISSLSSQSSWTTNALATAAAVAASSGGRTGEYSRLGGVKPTNLEDLQSPTGIQTCQNMNQQLRSSYPSNFSSPVRTLPSMGLGSSGGDIRVVLNSRSAAFTQRAIASLSEMQSTRHHAFQPLLSSANCDVPNLSDWGSPNGKFGLGYSSRRTEQAEEVASLVPKQHRKFPHFFFTSPCDLNAPRLTARRALGFGPW